MRLDHPESLTVNDRHRALFELRETLEVKSAELAADLRSDDEMQAIEEAFDEMVRTMDWGKSGVEYDIAFHRAVAAGSGNVFILETVTFIAEHLRESIELTRTNSTEANVNQVTIAEHRAILEAIRARDKAAARQAMTRHLTNAANRIGISLARTGERASK
ncbi:FadR/GntR family transcriptional regulator [Aestuariivirga sp.]|uniref:FadR/GntR family transcriptional regulator n=1 Tax=Aestuariivirga sp. TaxID=2650926 RepID=UPI0039E44F27